MKRKEKPVLPSKVIQDWNNMMIAATMLKEEKGFICCTTVKGKRVKYVRLKSR